MWRLKKRRSVFFGLACSIFLIYVLRNEITVSYDSRKSQISISPDLFEPLPLGLDLTVYIEGEKNKSTSDKFAKHSFNHQASDRVPLERIIPDSRHARCKNEVYSIPNGCSVSVIISFHNEARSALARTVLSILKRTPRRLLKEIILIDDFSDDAADGTELNDLPKIRIFRNNHRLGIAKSRMLGVQKSSGSHIMFLDSHCEVNKGFLLPLLQTSLLNPKALISPVIDIIDSDTFEYRPSSEMLKGGFDWSLNYRWQQLEGNETSESTFFKSPLVQGGLFLVEKAFFLDIGGLDKGLHTWGIENIEVSMKSWLCGGQVLTVPCSRVGHVFRNRHPYSFPMDGSVATYLHNSRRLAEAWLDEYKYHFYQVKPQAKASPIESIDEILSLKRRLRCKPFQWFLDNVYPELKPVNKDALAIGLLQQENLCLQRESTLYKSSVTMTMCSPNKPEQEWSFVRSGELLNGKLCLSAKLNLKKPKVFLAECNNNVKQKWSRRRRLLMLQGFCLEYAMDSVIGQHRLTLSPCRQNDFRQHWDFILELQNWGDR